MPTLIIATFDDDAVVFELEYVEVNRKITLIRCANNGSGNARGTLIDRITDAIVAQAVFVSGQITTRDVVGNYRVEFVPDPHLPGSPNMVELPYKTFIEYPVP